MPYRSTYPWSHTMKMKFFSAVLLSTTLLIGCGDDDESGEAEACEHLKEGPASSINASATTSGAPAVSNDHKRYDITFTDVTGGKGGTVSFAASEQAEYTLFLNASVPVEVKDANGQKIEPEVSGNGSSECDELKVRHTFPLKVGTHTFTFGPTTSTSVSLVLEEAAHEDHEH